MHEQSKHGFQMVLNPERKFINISGVIQKYGKKLKWFGQEQSSFELENEGRLLPVENADLIGRVGHGFIRYESFRNIGMNNPL